MSEPGSGLRCPLCETPMKVLETRTLKDGQVVRRRRECRACTHRLTTYETISHEGARRLPAIVRMAVAARVEEVFV